MAAAGGIRAGRAFIELFTDDSKLQRGLNAAANRLNNFGKGISSIGKTVAIAGGAITAPLIAAAKLSAEAGAAIYDMSRRTGISVEALSAFSYAADQTGADLGVVESSVKRMQKSIAGMADEAEGTTGKLDMLGLSAKDLVGLAPDEQFKRISKAIAGIKDPTQRAAAAMSVFGRSGTQLLPMIEDYDKLSARAKALGLIRTTKSAQEAKQFSMAMYDGERAVKSLMGALVSGIIPILRRKTDTMMRATLVVRDFVKGHRELVVIAFKAATALTLVGAGLMIAGKAISIAAPALKLVGAALPMLGSALGLLMNPIVLIGVGLVALVGYFLYASGNGRKLLGWLGEKFSALASIAKDAFGGIADALGAGDIALAAKILWTALQLAWATGTRELHEKWAVFTDAVLHLGADAWYGLLNIWAKVEAGLAGGIARVTAFFTDAWHLAIEKVTHWFDFLADRETNEEKTRLRKQIEVAKTPQEREYLQRQLKDSDKYNADAKGQRDLDDAQGWGDREKALKEKLAAIEAAKNKTIASNNEAHGNFADGADAAAKEEIEGLDKRKRELERELFLLRAQAFVEKAKHKPLGDDEKKQQVQTAVEQSGKTQAKAIGTFQISAASLLGLAAAPVQDRIAAATEKTAANTKKIADSRGGVWV